METNQNNAPFLSKMLWNTTNSKQELNLGMMPPPTSLVPVAQRRSSALIDSPPMRSMKTEIVDENSQGSVMEHMISDNSVDSMRHRFRPMSENSVDIHQEESNIAMINENTVEIMRRQEIINENSNLSINESFHEKSNHSIQNEDSVESIHSPVVQMTVLNSPVLVPTINQPILPPINPDLKGVDLRMKGIIPNDLADTQPPSMATLLKFGVTENTHMPLPAQTGQSIENFFMTTLENTVNKPVLSDTVANNKKPDNKDIILNNQVMSQLLTEQQNTETKIYQDQVINTLQPEILPALNESQIIYNPTNKIPTEVLKEDLITQQIINNNINVQTEALQAALNTNLIPTTATPKLDALVNSTVESHIGSPTRSPHEITNSPELIRRSPILPSTEIIINQTPEVLLNPQAPLLSSTLSPGSEILIRSPQNEIPQDVIMNPQVSPSVMCPQEILGPNLLPQNPLETCLPTQLQPELIQPENLPNMNLGIKVTLPNECLIPNQEIINPLMEQKAQHIIFEQQKQDLMNNLLIQQQQFDRTTVLNTIEEKKPEVKSEPNRPCQEMIPQALANMSENDLISYINPSCFEGTYTT